MPTITEIEDAIVAKLESRLESARKIGIQKGVEGIPQPAVYVSTESGKFKKVTMTKWRQTLTIYVDIVFKHLSNERERRKGVYAILEGVVQTLFLKTLDLAIDPIEPQSFRNTTTEDLISKGLMAFSLELETANYITELDDEEAVDLLRIGLNYYLTPGDDVVDASDLVTLSG
jgi:hypothetical protein